MNRLLVRIAAAALAAGMTVAELTGIAALEQAGSDPVATLPRVVITPAWPEDAPGETARNDTLPSRPSPRT